MCVDFFISFRRIREKLLHYFELKNGQKNTPGVLIKEFTRSAADAKVPKAKDMRTEQSLTKTVEYLLKEYVIFCSSPSFSMEVMIPISL